MFRIILLALGFLFLNACSSADFQEITSLDGIWHGQASTGEETTGVELFLKNRDDGNWQAKIGLSDIGVRDWSASSFQIDDSKIRIEITSDSGVGAMELEQVGNELRGTWIEPNYDDPAQLVLQKVEQRNSTNSLNVAEVSFVSADGTNLSGTLLLPEGNGPFTGVVFVHGSGPQTRDASTYMAMRLAEQGIASISYDKRGTGLSEGDWTVASLETLAEDAASAMNSLASYHQIKNEQVGLLGQSQGGWIGPIAAKIRPDTAFMVLVSGPWTPVYEEGYWNHTWAAREAGFEDESTLSRIETHLGLRDEAVRSGDWAPYLADIERVKNEPWFKAAQLDAEPDSDAWHWCSYALMIDFDPLPYFESLDIPLLSLFGSRDNSIPALKSAEMLEETADLLNKPYKSIIYNGAGHSLRIEDVNGRNPRWPGYPEGYFTTIGNWILRVTK